MTVSLTKSLLDILYNYVYFFLPILKLNDNISVRHQWLTSIILATQEAEIRRITVQSQPRQIGHETLSQKHPSLKRAGGVAQGVGPEFKPQCHTEKSRRALKIPQGLGSGPM
jgi:hypothetical protein